MTGFRERGRMWAQRFCSNLNILHNLEVITSLKVQSPSKCYSIRRRERYYVGHRQEY